MRSALKLLDKELNAKHILYICGGTAIALRFRARPTADVDVIEPEVFGSLLAAAKRVAASDKGQELGLEESWLNDHVGTMVRVADVLPSGWKTRSEADGSVFKGKFLTVYSLEKLDLLRTKLLSSVSPDRGADAVQDISDIAALEVSEKDLLLEAKWLMNADQHYVQDSTKKLDFYEKFIQETVIEQVRRSKK